MMNDENKERKRRGGGADKRKTSTVRAQLTPHQGGSIELLSGISVTLTDSRCKSNMYNVSVMICYK